MDWSSKRVNGSKKTSPDSPTEMPTLSLSLDFTV